MPELQTLLNFGYLIIAVATGWLVFRYVRNKSSARADSALQGALAEEERADAMYKAAKDFVASGKSGSNAYKKHLTRLKELMK